jgi:hypothetical protein
LTRKRIIPFTKSLIALLASPSLRLETLTFSNTSLAQPQSILQKEQQPQ